MKVTYNWLQEFIDIPWTPDELAEKLTMSGSEVESVEPVKSIYENVVIGLVKTRIKHEDADRLSVCTVDIGKEKDSTIVCGAPNVEAGMNVVVALPGALLPCGIKIEKAKIRGIKSFGMICSEVELGISDNSSGVLVMPNGHKAGEAFDPGNSADDYMLDIFINPNRPDCMSVYGIAREIAALSGKKLKNKPIELPDPVEWAGKPIEIEIKDEEKCPRYSTAIVSGIKVAPSGFDIQQRLISVGVRPINNIVDASNYALMEYGHPTHAFDLNEISDSKIVVKTADKDQVFVTLDDNERKLNENSLLICDNKRAVAIGGIMGGANSEITDKTVDILLEAAYFQPDNVQRTSQYIGLKTDASHRFERGMDPNFTIEALKRVCELIFRSSPGVLHSPYYDAYPKKISNPKVKLRYDRITKVLGFNYKERDIKKALVQQFLTLSEVKDGLKVEVPTFRHDLSREIDLIEEIARINGLNTIEAKTTATIPLRNVANKTHRALNKLRTYMTELGFMESFTYSMIHNKFSEVLSDRGEAIELKNPISPELSTLRLSILPNMLQVAEHNYNRGIASFRAFELGSTFCLDGKSDETVQKTVLSGVLYGQRVPPSWDHLDTPSDFFTAKGILESLFRKISLDSIEFMPYNNSYVEECSALILDGNQVGVLGLYKNKSLGVDFPEPLFVFEINAGLLIKHINKEIFYKPYSKFPPAKRDLSFVIPDAIPVQDVLHCIRDAGAPLLDDIVVSDVYRGEQLEFDKRSVKFGLRFNAMDRSLNDSDVEQAIQTILDAVQTKLKIDIRH